ncbi:DMSO/TMAO reductase YedYZ molybdopterin-dependent catalytic subunit [Bradyrhizobium sp. GM2.4]
MSRTFDKPAGTTRRRFLRASAAVAGGTVLGAGASAAAETDNLPPNVPEWMKAPGEPTGGQPYGAPSPFEKGVVKNISKTLKQYISASSRTPLQELDGIITPNGLFYERHHSGVPTIDPAQHRLMLHGLVERLLILLQWMISGVSRRNRASTFSNAPAIPATASLTARPRRTSWVW